jgi:hypothetical protein
MLGQSPKLKASSLLAVSNFTIGLGFAQLKKDEMRPLEVTKYFS